MLQLANGDVLQHLAKRVEPLLHLVLRAGDNLCVVDEDEVVSDLRLLVLDVQSLEKTESLNSGLNVTHGTRLLSSSLSLCKGLSVVDELKVFVEEALTVHGKFLLDLLSDTDKLQRQSRDDRIELHIVKEGVPNGPL